MMAYWVDQPARTRIRTTRPNADVRFSSGTQNAFRIPMSAPSCTNITEDRTAAPIDATIHQGDDARNARSGVQTSMPARKIAAAVAAAAAAAPYATLTSSGVARPELGTKR